MAYGPKVLFSDVTLNLPENRIYALIGGNGSGKSTLLRLLMGEEQPTLGELTFSRNKSVGWLRQDHFKYENDRIVDAVIRGNVELWDAIVGKQEIYDRGEFTDADGYKLGDLEEVILHHDGYEAEAKAQKLLTGLGIEEKYHFEPLKVLSGGYKLRVLLAQALFNNPDILLLDEPTNHLDMPAIEWLEDYLKNTFRGTLLFISHDVSFINNLSTHVIDLDYGEARLYTGNYNDFEKAKALVEEQEFHARENVEKRIAKMQAFVDRFKAKASKARQAQSRMKMIDKVEVPDIRESSRKAPFFKFAQVRPSGKLALKVTSLSKSFGEKKLFQKLDLIVNRGDKVVIRGENGIGKSTLLKTILGVHEPDEGKIEWGHEAYPCYFAQDHHEMIQGKMTTYEWLQRLLNEKTHTEVRALLGQMLFPKEGGEKMIETLSGGECARLLFANIMGQKHNILVLDEPTNHLDLEAIQALKKALKEYPGSLLLVTHDRSFADAVATKIVDFRKNGVDIKEV